MSDWIEINVPYCFDGENLDADAPEFPDLSNDARQHFGMSLKEAEDKYLDGADNVWSSKYADEYFQYEQKIRADILEKDSNIKYDELFKLSQEKLNNSNDPIIQKILTFEKFNYNYRIWENNHLLIKEYYVKMNEYWNLKQSLTFKGMGLDKVGTLIEVEKDGILKQYLLGDTIPGAEEIADFNRFQENHIVKRYKVVWSKEEND